MFLLESIDRIDIKKYAIGVHWIFNSLSIHLHHQVFFRTSRYPAWRMKYRHDAHNKHERFHEMPSKGIEVNVCVRGCQKWCGRAQPNKSRKKNARWSYLECGIKLITIIPQIENWCSRIVVFLSVLCFKHINNNVWGLRQNGMVARNREPQIYSCVSKTELLRTYTHLFSIDFQFCE